MNTAFDHILNILKNQTVDEEGRFPLVLKASSNLHLIHDIQANYYISLIKLGNGYQITQKITVHSNRDQLPETNSSEHVSNIEFDIRRWLPGNITSFEIININA